MKRINVIKDIGYGCFKTDCGNLTWDFDANGVDGVLINEENGQIYKIISDERDDEDNVKWFVVKEA
ncbi:MAG: hypothetical protein ACFWUC_13550 [Oscillospiraceae bacterium]